MIKKRLLFLLLVFYLISAKAQHQVDGIVISEFGFRGLPFVEIQEIGTQNKTFSDTLGIFELTTLTDPSQIQVSFPDNATQYYTVTSDTFFAIEMYTYDYYNTRWLSFGTSLESFNSLLGFQISNGTDEEPLIHFEDFQDKLLLKIYGQTDLGKNFAYGAEVGLNRLRYIGRTTLNYNRWHLEDVGLYLTDINLTSRVRYLHNTGLVFRAGYQERNGNRQFGIGAGIEPIFKNFYLGVNSRYYFSYFHHEAYVQVILLPEHFLSLRATYNRIKQNNLLSIGINYAFVRNENR